MSADSEKPNIIGVIGRNIALWQNLWVGEGRFERRSSSARVACALRPVQSIDAFPYYCPGARRGNIFVATWLLRHRPRGAQA